VSLIGASDRLAALQKDAKLAESATEDVIVVEGSASGTARRKRSPASISASGAPIRI
jgi:hypothetical protein